MALQPAHGIGTRTFRGMVWAYGSFVGVRLSSLVTTAILARLLAPRDFGLIALAMTFMAFLDMLQGLGVSQALVVADAGTVHEKANTAFTISSAMGVALWLLAAALGPLAATLFRQPRMVEVMPALGLTFLMYGLGSTHYALALREIDFRARTACEIANAVARGLVGIVLALAGLGVWSLIAGYVAGTLAMDVSLWVMVAWRPRWRLDRAHGRSLLGFGGALTGVAVMGAFLNQFDNALVGRVLGAGQLGLYSIAGRLPYLLIISLAVATGQVLFPAFASLSADRMRAAFLLSLRYTALVALPLTAFLVVMARPLTLIVFGPRWLAAVAPTQVFCAWALMSPVTQVCGNALKARGRATLLFALSVPQAIGLVVGSLLFVHQGILAVSWVQATIAVVAQGVTLAVTDRVLSLPTGRVLAAVAWPLLAAGLMAGVMMACRLALTGSVLVVAVGGVAGAAVYVGVCHLLMPDLLTRLVAMALPSRARPAVAFVALPDEVPPPLVLSALRPERPPVSRGEPQLRDA